MLIDEIKVCELQSFMYLYVFFVVVPKNVLYARLRTSFDLYLMNCTKSSICNNLRCFTAWQNEDLMIDENQNLSKYICIKIPIAYIEDVNRDLMLAN